MYFLLTVLGLAIGISAMILSSLYYLEESSYDQWNPNKDDVFVVESKIDKDISWMLAPYPIGEKLKEELPFVEEFMYLRTDYFMGVIDYKEKRPMYEKGIMVQSNFFDFFPFEFVYGDRKTALKNTNNVVVRDSYAKILFGKENPVGEEFTDEGENYVVTGVYTLGDNRSSIAPELIFGSLDKVVKDEQNNWGNYNSALYLRLSDKKYCGQVEKEILRLLLANSYQKLASEKGMSLDEFIQKELGFLESFRLHPLSGQHLSDSHLNGTLESSVNTERMYILIGLSIILLILSLFNYINISIVQLIERKKEFGVRKVHGCVGFTFAKQGFFEGLLTAIIAIVLSLVLVEFTIPFLRVFLKSQLSGFNLMVIIPFLLFFVLLIGVLTGVLFTGITRANIFDLLRGKVLGISNRVKFNNLILIIQFAIAGFFIISVYTVNRQVSYMLSKDLGFKGDQVISMRYLYNGENTEKVKTYERIKERVEKIEGVKGVSVSTIGIGNGAYNSTHLSYKGNFVQIMNVAMDYNYLDMLGIKMKEGRNFNEQLASDSISNVLINEEVLSHIGETDMVGKKLNWNDKDYLVVGIVSNYNTRELNKEYAPMIFFSLKTVPWVSGNMNEISIQLESGNIEKTLKDIEKVYTELNISDFPFSYEFVDKRFSSLFEDNIYERNVFLVLSSIAVFIALFGLFAVSSFTIGTKLKEVAIRKVLGADTSSLLKRLSMQYVIYCVIGFAIAVFPSYYFLNKWLSNYAFRIEIGWGVFAISFVVILCLTLIIVLSRAYLATRINVLKYIKYE